MRIGTSGKFGLALLSLIMAVAFAAGQGSGCLSSPSIFVPEDSSIQAAVDAAAEGAVLYLAPGQYVENVTISKGISLCGPSEGVVEIVGTCPGPVLRIVGEGIEVRLEDVAIRRARGYNGHGLAVEGSAVVELTRIALTDNEWCGIWASDHAVVTLSDCVLTGNGTSGTSSRDFAQLRLTGCTISDNMSHGVFALHLSEVSVDETEIRNNWAGIWAWDATRVYVQDSQLIGNGAYGAIASTAALLVIEESLISDNGHDGLLFEASSRGVLRRSRITSNGANGLFAQEDAILEITDCEFLANESAGLRLSESSCFGGFDPKLYFAGEIKGSGNRIPGPDDENGNLVMALCPQPPSLWPAGFIAK